MIVLSSRFTGTLHAKVFKQLDWGFDDEAIGDEATINDEGGGKSDDKTISTKREVLIVNDWLASCVSEFVCLRPPRRESGELTWHAQMGGKHKEFWGLFYVAIFLLLFV
jgi:hypothetical protein